jgi:hypothetical protein
MEGRFELGDIDGDVDASGLDGRQLDASALDAHRARQCAPPAPERHLAGDGGEGCAARESVDEARRARVEVEGDARRRIAQEPERRGSGAGEGRWRVRAPGVERLVVAEAQHVGRAQIDRAQGADRRLRAEEEPAGIEQPEIGPVVQGRDPSLDLRLEAPRHASDHTGRLRIGRIGQPEDRLVPFAHAEQVEAVEEVLAAPLPEVVGDLPGTILEGHRLHPHVLVERSRQRPVQSDVGAGGSGGRQQRDGGERGPRARPTPGPGAPGRRAGLSFRSA